MGGWIHKHKDQLLIGLVVTTVGGLLAGYLLSVAGGSAAVDAGGSGAEGELASSPVPETSEAPVEAEVEWTGPVMVDCTLRFDGRDGMREFLPGGTNCELVRFGSSGPSVGSMDGVISYCHLNSEDQPDVRILIEVRGERRGWVALNPSSHEFVETNDPVELFESPTEASRSELVPYSDLDGMIVAMRIRGTIREAQTEYIASCRDFTRKADLENTEIYIDLPELAVVSPDGSEAISSVLDCTVSLDVNLSTTERAQGSNCEQIAIGTDGPNQADLQQIISYCHVDHLAQPDIKILLEVSLDQSRWIRLDASQHEFTESSDAIDVLDSPDAAAAERAVSYTDLVGAIVSMRIRGQLVDASDEYIASCRDEIVSEVAGSTQIFLDVRALTG